MADNLPPNPNSPTPAPADLSRDYWCFISYSHVDNRQPGRQWATWLQQSLETYEVPADLVGRKNERDETIPDRIFPVFRDEEDLPADADLSRPIEAALRRSRFLVVICSPKAAASKFVDDEVRIFKQLGKGGSLLAAMIAGEPNAEGSPAKDAGTQECFPKSLRYRVDEQGRLTDERVEPIAADFRLTDGTPGWTGQAPYREALQASGTPSQQLGPLVESYAKRHHLMFLKIVAGILGVPLGELTRRDQAYQLALQQRRTKILRRWLAAVSALAILAATAGWLALRQADRAETGEAEAIARLARSNYFLAESRWKENRVSEARELLSAVPSVHRHFEWRLARREYEGSDVTLYGHTAGVTCVAFSPDGERLASASDDNTIRIWDGRSGAEVRKLAGHANHVTSVAFSPDGGRLASASRDKTIKLWDARSGEELRTLTGHTNDVTSVTFSPGGGRLASASWDKTIKLWDSRSGEVIGTLIGHSDRITSVGFSPDGSRLASSSQDKSIRLWDILRGEEIRALAGHPIRVNGLSFSPDGTRLASASLDRSIKIWDSRSGDVLRTIVEHSLGVTSVVFSPDGARVASASTDHTINVCDAHSGEKLLTFVGHIGAVTSVTFSPDGARLASAGRDSTIKLWDTRTGRSIRALAGHTSSVECVTFGADGTRIASAGLDNTIKLWDAISGDGVRTLTGHSEPVASVSFSPDGALLASASADKTIKFWDAGSGRERRTLTGHTDAIDALAFSPNGELLASGSSDGEIKLWDARSAGELRSISGHSGNIECLAFSPDGSRLASASSSITVTDKTIRLWDPHSGEELSTIATDHSGFSSVVFSPDGVHLASASHHGTIKLWDVGSGKAVRTFTGHELGVSCVVFNPEGTRLASASADNTVKLWDVSSGQELRSLAGHAAVVTSVAFSPDGTHLASASWDHTIILWDANADEEFRTYTGHTATVEKAALSPDERTVFGQGILGERIAWSLEGCVQIEQPDAWPDFNAPKSRSVDGRWLAIPSGNSVLLVDDQFKTSIDTKAYREFKAKLDPWWHTKQAKAADQLKPQPDRYAAAFHWAWVVKAYLDKPEKAAELKEARERLSICTAKWREEFAAEHRAAAELAEKSADPSKPKPTPTSDNPDDYLAPTVREMLKK